MVFRASLLSTLSLLVMALAAGSWTAPASAQQSATAVGPTFDCQRARDPVAAVVCSDDGLKRLDIEYVQAYQALSHQLPEHQRRALRLEAIAFGQSVVQSCRLPRLGAADAAAAARAVPCVAQAYRAQRADYMGLITSPDAAQEARRDAAQHIALQARLAETGLIAATSKADGVYGSVTRDAIARLQARRGLPQSGLMTDLTAQALTSGTPVASAEAKAASSTPAVPVPSAAPVAGQATAAASPLRPAEPPLAPEAVDPLPPASNRTAASSPPSSGGTKLGMVAQLANIVLQSSSDRGSAMQCSAAVNQANALVLRNPHLRTPENLTAIWQAPASFCYQAAFPICMSAFAGSATSQQCSAMHAARSSSSP